MPESADLAWFVPPHFKLLRLKISKKTIFRKIEATFDRQKLSKTPKKQEKAALFSVACMVDDTRLESQISDFVYRKTAEISEISILCRIQYRYLLYFSGN